MPRRLPMSTILLRAREWAGMVGDDSIEDPELRSRASERYGDLWGVVAATGLRYFEYSKQFTTTGLATLAEPTDHLATVDEIEYVWNVATGARRRLRQIGPAERSRWSGMTGGEARRWELVDDTIYLYPTPPSGQIYELRYVPQPPDLTSFADADVVDVVTPDGEAFLVWGMVVGMLAKAKSDVTLAMQREAEARKRLEEWAALRAFSLPRRYVDDYEEVDDLAVENRDLFWVNR